ncbi:hypothetical protein [Litoribacterium kuwaitense]|uniref:hypothetical protein n=1 Tax=Litoribacterium kuwaitense TaxID=1398745 RepID=UPI0035E411C0
MSPLPFLILLNRPKMHIFTHAAPVIRHIFQAVTLSKVIIICPERKDWKLFVDQLLPLHIHCFTLLFIKRDQCFC